MAKKNIIVTVGPPGAGKSTWADKHLVQTCLRLERDRFREAIWGSRRAYHESTMPHQEKSYVVGSAMYQAMKVWPYPLVALTDTGLFWNSVKRFIAGNNVRVMVFNTPDDVLRERNQTRPEEHRVPPHILEDMIRAFHAEDAWWKTGVWDVHEVCPRNGEQAALP